MRNIQLNHTHFNKGMIQVDTGIERGLLPKRVVDIDGDYPK